MYLGAHFISSRTEPYITGFCDVSTWYNSFYKTLNITLQAEGEIGIHRWPYRKKQEQEPLNFSLFPVNPAKSILIV